jgi:flagellar basal body-associated protein FliL
MLFSHWGQLYAVTRIKKQGMLFYLRTLQAVRRSLLAVVAFICCLQLMVLGLIGAIVTGVLLTNTDPQTKLWILLGVSLLILVLPMIGLAMLFSEKAWLQASGAADFFHAEKEQNKDLDEVLPEMAPQASV